jgi:hypothetical protein
LIPGHRRRFRGTSGGSLKRFRLFFVVSAVVLALSTAKVLVHRGGLEFLSLNALFTSAVAAAIFIIGFLLSSVLSDYKEAERLPSDMRVAMESIRDDVNAFAASGPRSTQIVEAVLLDVLSAVTAAVKRDGDADLSTAIAHVDRLTPCFADLDRAGLPPNYVVRLRGEQAVLRRCLFRLYHIQRIQFVPSVHILVQTLSAAIIALLLFLRTEGSPESALIFGFIAYMFIYALYLIQTLERPFQKKRPSLDDVSLFLLREFEEKVEQRVISSRVHVEELVRSRE